MREDANILSINGGSSSIKFSLYQAIDTLELIFSGAIEIGAESGKLHFTKCKPREKGSVSIKSANHEEAANSLIDWLEKQEGYNAIEIVGHRVVHGLAHTEPEIVDADLLKELKEISIFDPEHLPDEINLIELFSKRHPSIKQVACFDTSFHTTMPRVAKLLAIPRRYYEKGVQRYGFHGLSYAYLLEELARIAGYELANGKVILAHLGSGASLAAVKEGKSIDTSMGFTPTSGVPMSSRTGDLDPGVASYLLQHEKLSAKEFSHLINHESGLLGISESSADMRELQKIQETDSRAKEAITLFCYQTRKWIGSFAAVLGGLEVLVFSGGIGEHSPEVRSMICDKLQFLGIELDEIRNRNNEVIISTDASTVKVFAIKTNEELMIAKLALKFLK